MKILKVFVCGFVLLLIVSLGALATTKIDGKLWQTVKRLIFSYDEYIEQTQDNRIDIKGALYLNNLGAGNFKGIDMSGAGLSGSSDYYFYLETTGWWKSNNQIQCAVIYTDGIYDKGSMGYYTITPTAFLYVATGGAHDPKFTLDSDSDFRVGAANDYFQVANSGIVSFVSSTGNNFWDTSARDFIAGSSTTTAVRINSNAYLSAPVITASDGLTTPSITASSNYNLTLNPYGSRDIKLAIDSDSCILDGADNIIYDRGSSVPADGTAGYSIGCIFIDTTTTGAGNRFLVNEGDTTTCDFNAFGRRKGSIVLTAAGGIPAITNGPAQTQVEGTNLNYYVLDYDSDTDESCYWEWVCADNYDGGNVDVTAIYISTNTADDVVWNISTVGIADGETVDTNLGDVYGSTDTAKGTAGQMNEVTFAAFDPGWAKGDYVIFKCLRDANIAGDTHTADARLLKIRIEYTIKGE